MGISSSAGASSTAKGGMKINNSSKTCVGESSKQGAAKSGQGTKRYASSQPAFNQTNNNGVSVTNKVIFTVVDPKGKKKPKKYIKV